MYHQKESDSWQPIADDRLSMRRHFQPILRMAGHVNDEIDQKCRRNTPRKLTSGSELDASDLLHDVHLATLVSPGPVFSCENQSVTDRETEFPLIPTT
jgi:hypothetical protein